MGMFDFLSGNPLSASPTDGFSGLAANPLFAMGLQMMQNSAKQVGGSRPLFEGMLPALSGAARNSALMQSMKAAGQQQEWQKQQQEWAKQDRASHAATLAQINAALSGQNDYARDVAAAPLAMAGEPPSTQALGPPMPPNPLSAQSLMPALLNDPQTYGPAINSILNPKKPNYFTVGNNLVDASGNVVFSDPNGDTKLASKGYKAALAQGFKPGTPQFAEFAGKVDQSSGGGSPYFTSIPYTDAQGNPGILSFDNRRGTVSPLSLNGAAVIKSGDSVPLQSNLAGGKAGAAADAKTTATAQAQARLDLPGAEAKTQYAINLLEGLKTHPGMSAVVGMPGITNWIPGTDAAGFKAGLNQLKGQTFLEAYQMLKGGGQITEIEGQKAEQALARMDTAQSEKDFKQALSDYQDVLRAGLTRLKSRAGMQGAGGANPGGAGGSAPGVKFLGFE